MNIRKATTDDLPTIMRIIDHGRDIMRKNGNTKQWTNGYPSEKQILTDIDNGNGYLICENGTPVATFAMIIGDEPTYKEIFNGQWIDNSRQYTTIHRLATTSKCHGIAELCFDFAWEKTRNIRIDTHRDNLIMRHIAEKYEFLYCGIIYLDNGDERLAFQKTEN
ncbi:MAG: N-acetyltransferase [Bacteroidales bacterium]|nr:N-acetyltransferase [Bacteroidales bacterium]